MPPQWSMWDVVRSLDRPVCRTKESSCQESSSLMPSKTSTAGYRGKAGRAAAIESGTGSNVTDYVAADGSNNVVITADVSDSAALQGMLASRPPEVCGVRAAPHRA